MTFKAVIVEDELASQKTLEGYLKKYCTEVEVRGIASTVAEGTKMVESLKPDIVFLDIEMPFGNGFDLLEQVSYSDFRGDIYNGLQRLCPESHPGKCGQLPAKTAIHR